MAVNKVILLGNVGKDPEIRYVENDRAVANFTMATTERGFTTRDGRQIPDRTEWHNIVVWGGLAKVVEGYVRKGTQLYVEGKMRTRFWDDDKSVRHYITEVYVDELQLVGKKSDNPATNMQAAQATASNNPAPATQTTESSASTTSNIESTTNESSESEDDLPF